MIRSINNNPNNFGLMNRMTESETPPSQLTQPEAGTSPRVVASSDLFEGGRVVVIEHAGQQYRLLITRNDRLILQK